MSLCKQFIFTMGMRDTPATHTHKTVIADNGPLENRKVYVNDVEISKRTRERIGVQTKTFIQKQTNTQSQHTLIYWYNFQSAAPKLATRTIIPILTKCTQGLCHDCCHNNTKNTPLIKMLECYTYLTLF